MIVKLRWRWKKNRSEKLVWLDLAWVYERRRGEKKLKLYWGAYWSQAETQRAVYGAATDERWRKRPRTLVCVCSIVWNIFCMRISSFLFHISHIGLGVLSLCLWSDLYKIEKSTQKPWDRHRQAGLNLCVRYLDLMLDKIIIIFLCSHNNDVISMLDLFICCWCNFSDVIEIATWLNLKIFPFSFLCAQKQWNLFVEVLKLPQHEVGVFEQSRNFCQQVQVQDST